MLLDWLAAWPALLAAVLVLFAPGFAVASALRLRGLASWALAPVGSVAVLAALALCFPFIGVPWSAVSIALGIVSVVALAWLGARGLGAPRERPMAPTARRLLLGGIVVGVVVGALRFCLYVGDPRAISQTNDAVFHLNALRWIGETGSASSLTLTGVIDASTFYPAAWHAVTSAVVAFSGTEIPTAVNMVSLVIMAMIWPIGVAWLVQVATASAQYMRGISLAPAFAAALSGVLLTFPLMLFIWGVLYPNALSLVLVPAAAAVVMSAPSWLSGDGPVDGRVRVGTVLVLLIGASVVALALAQPSSLLAWGVLVVSWFVGWALHRARDVAGRERILLRTAAVGAIVAFGIVWFVLSRLSGGSHWPHFRSRTEAVLDVVINSQLDLPPALGVSILAVIGLFVTARAWSLRWLTASWFVFAGMYWIVAAVGRDGVRGLVLGAWYADPYRVAALSALVVVPLAAIGLAAFCGWVAEVLGTRSGARERTGARALAVLGAIAVVAVLVAPVVPMPQITTGTKDDQSRYAINDRSYLSPDERVLLERLDATTAPGSVILGNPSTGSAFGYVLSGRTVYPRTWAPPQSEQWNVLALHLRDAATNPEVCDAWRAYGEPEYVVDFGPGVNDSGRWKMPGFTGFEGREGFTRIDQEGDASLWRIDACS